MKIDVTPQQFKDLVLLGIPLIVCINSYLTISSKTKKALSEMDHLKIVIPKEILSLLKSHALTEAMWLFIVTSVYLFFVLSMASGLIGVWLIMMSSLLLMVVAKIILNLIMTSRYEKRWNEVLKHNPAQIEELELSRNSLTEWLKSRV